MPKYKIDRWNSVIPPGNINPFPMIYVTPDKNFADYAEENNYTVIVNIEGTGKIYDGKSMVGIIDSSAYFPSYRPNFYNEKGYFVITLYSQWRGYPTQDNGYVIIKGLKGEDKLQIPESIPYEAPKPVTEMYTPPESCKSCSMSNEQLMYVLMGLLIFFCVLIYIATKK
jgi:hypothetical protein